MKTSFYTNIFILIAIVLGIICGKMDIAFLYNFAQITTELFIKLLNLLSLPIIFFALVANISHMESFEKMKKIGGKILFYSIFTTIIAALIGWLVYSIIQPAQHRVITDVQASTISNEKSYFSFLFDAIPDNIIHPFFHSNVIGIAFIGLVLGIAILFLPKENKKVLQSFFSSFFSLFLTVTKSITFLMPLAIWAFVTIFVKEMKQENIGHHLFLFTACVVGANLIQGIIILPLLLKFKKISPIHTIKSSLSALLCAFFTKSSNAALPITMKCAENNLKLSPNVSRVSLSLCSIINMNACAAFIFITVMFVANSHGVAFSLVDMLTWIVLATIAAMGNAGVPMGCYFLANAFLISMNLPLKIMGLILPLYAIIDMLETALNVWSDICVTSVIDKELKIYEKATEPSTQQINEEI